MEAAAAECVRVAVRCRPLNKLEISDSRKSIVEIDTSLQQAGVSVIVQPARGSGELPKTFTFDNVFDWNSTQTAVYSETAKPIVDSVLEGYNGTVFAYGQTGTGKTHTMDGGAAQVSEQQQFLVRASFLEIYNEEVRDLLSKNPKNKLELKERKDQGVYVKGLNSFVVKSVAEITSVLEVGKKNRSVGATLMNQDSSRSHSIFTITVEKLQQGEGKACCSPAQPGQTCLVCFVWASTLYCLRVQPSHLGFVGRRRFGGSRAAAAGNLVKQFSLNLTRLAVSGIFMTLR
ncbi:Envelope glycoprotein gp160 [Trebouxia sp. C0010 RCD-2024]